MTDARLADVSSVVLGLAGLLLLVRADGALQAISGLVLLLSAISIAVVRRRAPDQHEP